MQRKIQLSRGAVLWEKGDIARNIAILEQGKLAVYSGERLLGFCWPRMVLGESALLSFEGLTAQRTATVLAAEDGTLVIEYPPSALRQAVAAGSHPVPGIILATLVGLVCKDCILLLGAEPRRTALEGPLKGLLSGLLAALPSLQQASGWEEFMFNVRFLSGLRDYSESLRAQLLPAGAEAPDAVERASATAQELFRGHDIMPFLEELLRAGREPPGPPGPRG